jgi:chromosome segregation ATPase
MNLQANLSDEKKTSTDLQTTINQRTADVLALSNKLSVTEGVLVKATTEAKTAAESAAAEIAKRDKQISDLESDKDDLTKRMGELNLAITGLEGQITETRRKLDASEGDRTSLLKDLQRLQAEKADLERKFQDLAVLREQVHKLREELSIARRLDFIRRGLYGFDKKGAQLVQEGIRVKPVEPVTGAGDLNVELNTEGGARVVPKTNAPPANTPAPK